MVFAWALLALIPSQTTPHLYVVAENVVVRQTVAPHFVVIESPTALTRLTFSKNVDPSANIEVSIWARDAIKKKAWTPVAKSGELILPSPCRKCEIKFTANVAKGTISPCIRLITAAVAGAKYPREGNKKASNWGQITDLVNPTESFAKDATGGIWCVARTAQFWAKAIGRPDFNLKSDELFQRLGGSFSSAQLASLVGTGLGLRSYVTYFRSSADLDPWLEDALPVICLLKDSSSAAERYAILKGFDASGDAVIEQLAGDAGKESVVPRQVFLNSWRIAQNKVVLIHPSALTTPNEGATSDVWVAQHTDG